MKKILLLGVFLFTLNLSFSQTTKQNVERDFINYSKLISENKIDEALEYANPKLFEVFPKENMKNLMEAVFKMPNIEYKIFSPIIKEISEVKKLENIDYIKIKTISPIEMKFTDIDLNDKNSLQMMLNSFETKFGRENVIYNQETGFFKINANKEIIASSTDDKKNWKFITIDNPRMKTLLEKVVPSEILEQ
ncbi:hypothetical protein SAMN02927937_00009 [Paenimyroides aquimaris]|uniref:DUF4252 domain-containing protein n=1 Tax=Paenimyroides marinum TaxID=1159016 RepID=A0A1H6J3D3_9FLAO|nr:hypothetical protein [Paenimyroides aquimaris]SEH53387.1 hypothetical protein SAMN02927937_00009 [Paenimyroides aquimaris]